MSGWSHLLSLKIEPPVLSQLTAVCGAAAVHLKSWNELPFRTEMARTDYSQTGYSFTHRILGWNRTAHDIACLDYSSIIYLYRNKEPSLVHYPLVQHTQITAQLSICIATGSLDQPNNLFVQKKSVYIRTTLPVRLDISCLGYKQTCQLRLQSVLQFRADGRTSAPQEGENT